jgi:predicted aminopeptidase
MNTITKWRLKYNALVLAFFVLLGSCTSITGPGYYSHLILGQTSILIHRTSIQKLLADKHTSPDLKEKLRGVQEMREFAIYELGLSPTDSFTTYVDVKREFASWVLTSTPEFSVLPKQWCFPFVGCASYLNFFDEERAKQAEKILTSETYDVSYRGASAFSTVGRFDDPVLNTLFQYKDDSHARTVFHEMAHEKMRIKSDTSYNEAFAMFVGKTGHYLWVAKKYGLGAVEKLTIRDKRASDVIELVNTTHNALRSLYQKNYDVERMRTEKQKIFDEMKQHYLKMKNEWGGYEGFDDWFMKNFNNADIVSENEYHKLIPFFQKLFELSGKNFPAFYEKAERIAKLPKFERYLEIEKILSK